MCQVPQFYENTYQNSGTFLVTRVFLGYEKRGYAVGLFWRDIGCGAQTGMRSDSDAESARRRSRSRERDAVAQDGGAGRGDGQGVSREQLEALRSVTLIERNEYPLEHLPREKVYPQREDDDDAQSVCYCEYPDNMDVDKKRCDDVSCLNFATYVECNPRCRAGEYCCNQRLQNPDLFPELEAFKVRGFPLCADAMQKLMQSSLLPADGAQGLWRAHQAGDCAIKYRW